MEPGNPTASWEAGSQWAGSAGYERPAARWKQDRLRCDVCSTVSLRVRLGPPLKSHLCLASISRFLLLLSLTCFFSFFPNKPLAHKVPSQGLLPGHLT